MQDDMIPPHRHVDASSVSDAISVLEEYGGDATLIAGNTDEMEWLKNRSRAPDVVVDLKNIDDLHGVEESDDGGLRIGALTSLSDVSRDGMVQDDYPIIAESADAVATPQIRNQGTIGGNLAQDSRCWYYREDFDCYRAGGNTCYATTGDAREHALTDYSRCITANPSDVAPALIALDAEVLIEGPSGERRQSVEDFFVGPETNITVMNTLSQREVLKEIIVPATWQGATYYYEKVRDREAWDFALLNLAVTISNSGGSVSDSRLVSNGLAPVPKRLTEAEEVINGNELSESRIEQAAESILPNADPYPTNEYKIPLARNVLERGLASAK
ncbi:FAD binding domain-containing protein [Natronorarus salvus]|uniref:FAD binding domain-containing protein n=1 Tax=Natronorarus salvus TaxID=3117733 RepID=UPI002F2627F2